MAFACAAATAAIWTPAASAQDGSDPCVTDPTACPAPAPAFGTVDVTGPKKAKRGTVVTFKVTLRNTGDAPAANVSLVASGAGTGSKSFAELAAGQETTVKLRVTLGKRTGSRTLKVTVTADGDLRAVGKTTIKVTKPAKKKRKPKEAPGGFMLPPPAPQLPIVNGGS